MHDLSLRMQAFSSGMRWGSGARLQGSPSWVHHFLVCLLAQMTPSASICSVKWASSISQTPWSRDENQTGNNRCRTRSTPGLQQATASETARSHDRGQPGAGVAPVSGLGGYSPGDPKELDQTEVTEHTHRHIKGQLSIQPSASSLTCHSPSWNRK